MTSYFHFDFETQSLVNLMDCGAYKYAADPSTKVLMMGYQFVRPGYVMSPALMGYGKDFKSFLLNVLEKTDSMFVAHNAMFERLICKLVLGLEIPLERIICTQAMCRYYGYPGSLEQAVLALGVPYPKDMSGKQAMLAISCPDEHGFLATPETHPAEFLRTGSYCIRDVEAEHGIFEKLPQLPDWERNMYRLDQEINDRGVPVNTSFLNNAVEIALEIEQERKREFTDVVEGKFETAKQVKELRQWLESKGYPVPDMKADTVVQLLRQPNLPDDVRAALRLRQELAKTSLTKFATFLDWEVQGRIYGAYVYYAAHTGREQSWGVNLANLSKASPDFEINCKIIRETPWLFKLIVDDVMQELAQLIRGAVEAPDGKIFLGLDLAQIEARIVAWISGHLALLEGFAQGRDVYCEEASKMFGEEVTPKDKAKRAVGKVAVLSMGYEGGIQAVVTNAGNSNTDLGLLAEVLLPTASYDELRSAEWSYKRYCKGNPKPVPYQHGLACDLIKQRYRKNNPIVVESWTKLSELFWNGGEIGMFKFERDVNNLTTVTLPVGRQMFFHGVENDGGLSYLTAKGTRTHIYGGKIMENLAQAHARDVFVFYLNKLTNVIFHTYDEYLKEVNIEDVELHKEEIRQAFQIQPPFSPGLPIAYEMWTDKIYSK